MEKILEIAHNLNKIYLYNTLDEDEIDCISYHSSQNNYDFDRLLATKCSTTVKVLIYLFKAKFIGVIGGISEMCVVEISSKDIKCPSHTFVFHKDHIYHSYAMNYTLRIDLMKKKDLDTLILKFKEKPTTKLWKKLTHVNDFKEGNYHIQIYKYKQNIENNKTIANRVNKMIEEALDNVDGKKDERYLWDDFTLLLPENRELFLKTLQTWDKNYQIE